MLNRYYILYRLLKYWWLIITKKHIQLHIIHYYHNIHHNYLDIAIVLAYVCWTLMYLLRHFRLTCSAWLIKILSALFRNVVTNLDHMSLHIHVSTFGSTVIFYTIIYTHRIETHKVLVNTWQRDISICVDWQQDHTHIMSGILMVVERYMIKSLGLI